MPFVEFENSVGRGIVVPDALGGTQLRYLSFKSRDLALKARDQFGDQVVVGVDHAPPVLVEPTGSGVNG